MINVQLKDAGFYEIAWPELAHEAGVTYVRPGSRECVRVFVPANSSEVEVYAGNLKEGKLVFRGPAETAATLRWLAHNRN
ncbi:hypothetical protein [Hymenobacter sp. BT730]|uniref:hypothetical protein n=1 Tax=Hymenobacter sp. BT730 TaxID=3063332 RepID=UPI0026E087D1|nr:hypothetical protein [Hymenobacter sp. BT730]